MSSFVLNVTGMSCEGCVRAVTASVAAAAPAARVSVDLKTGRVTVLGAEDPAAVAAAIEGAGFSIVKG